MARSSVRLTDAQWAQIEPHLPRPRRSPKGGRPRVSHREVVEGILWVLKTGARWRDLPEGYPSGSTCWRRLRQWHEAGTEPRARILRPSWEVRAFDDTRHAGCTQRRAISGRRSAI